MLKISTLILLFFGLGSGFLYAGNEQGGINSSIQSVQSAESLVFFNDSDEYITLVGIDSIAESEVSTSDEMIYIFISSSDLDAFQLEVSIGVSSFSFTDFGIEGSWYPLSAKDNI